MSNRIAFIVTCALATAHFFFSGNEASAQQGQQGSAPVTVVNTPLPVRVVNPPNAPSTVNVGNPADIAKALGIQQPVVFFLNRGQKFTVPLGQRLVIEYVSGTCIPFSLNDGTGFPPSYQGPSIDTITGGFTAIHTLNRPIFPIPLPSGARQGDAFIQIGHLVKIYADTGTDVGLGGDCALQFSGQLVTVP